MLAACYPSGVSTSSPSPTAQDNFDSHLGGRGHSGATRDDIRNIAIVAHVDHGKTTLVDAMLHQTGAFGSHSNVSERAMDSMDQEQERGITILAKNTAVNYGGLVINVVDTPGHADFSGEVERGLAMVDGVALLVDAAEGPLPQTRFVLRKALERGMPIVLVVNKVDRHDARPAEVVDEVLDLLIDLGADDSALDIPTIYAIGRDGKAGPAPDQLADDLTPLFDMLIKEVPAPSYDPEAPLQALVTNLDASPYLGRIALLRIVNGEISKGQQVAWMHEANEVSDDAGHVEITRAKVVELLVTQAMTRVPGESARAGDIIAISGIENITIGDTIGDLEDPRPLPRLTVDEPAIAMEFRINDSPLAGLSGKKVTARLIKERIDRELIGNVSIRLNDLGVPDRWEIQGRGEMQLAVLIESMRREGYELTVGKPRVLTMEDENGKLMEPVELAVVDVPEEFVGAVTQLMGTRKGRMVNMGTFGAGWSRIQFHVPARGLIGFRTTFLSATQGTGQLHSTFHAWEPWMGELRLRQSGSLVADRPGPATQHAIVKLEDRGTLFVEPTDDVYEGRIVGEHIRPEDLDVNIVREKHLTNHRSATGDELVRMNRARKMSLDEALEFIREDECVEVTPDAIRLRKSILHAGSRHSARAKDKNRNANA
ncbi:MAG: typA [Thermoleophilia bacterium]|nr:typA [Thermoleophilia bacterium]